MSKFPLTPDAALPRHPLSHRGRGAQQTPRIGTREKLGYTTPRSSFAASVATWLRGKLARQYAPLSQRPKVATGRGAGGEGIRLLTLLALLVILLPPAAAHAQGEPPPTPDPRFGAVETYHTPELAGEAGVGWTRIIFYWSELKKDGPEEWNEFHAPLARIDREIAGGREVVGLLKHTPAFATDGIEGAGVPRGLYLPVDDPGNLWAGFVREVVSAYEGRINRWIIWNEPDIPIDVFGAAWQGSVADYYQLVKVAYLAAHEVDPDVQIHLGGLTYWHNPGYLREFLTAASADPTAAENGYYFDVVSLHVYFKPETTLDIVGATRATLAEFGLEKPIWINETNAPPYDDPAQPWEEPVFRVTQEMQASFLVQEFALALALDVERIAVYKWVDEPEPLPGFEPYGLVRYDRSLRPAYDAFRTIVRLYSGTVDAVHVERPELQQVMLFRGGSVTRVLWARTPTGVAVRVPALADSALLVDATGGETRLMPRGGEYRLTLAGAPCTPDSECLMGGPPLLLVEEASPAPESWPEMAAQVEGLAAQNPSAPAVAGDSPASSVLRAGGLALPPLAIVLGAGVALIVAAAIPLLRRGRD